MILKIRKPRILAVRVALVQAIAEVNPAFICFTGDIVYNGYDVKRLEGLGHRDQHLA
jgi:hypothetical protein